LEFIKDEQSSCHASIDRVKDSLQPSGYTEFPEDAVQMGLDGLLADEELLSNFFVGTAAAEAG